jgi:hypothetical protein
VKAEIKRHQKSVGHNVHLVERDSSNDDSMGVYTAELIWSTKAKPSACSSLQLVQKNRQEEVKFIFNVTKCNKIFDELLKSDNIKVTHIIPPLYELKIRAYCKWHNSFSQATSDCNVFHQQIQSAINEGRLSFQEMQIYKQPFLVNIMELAGKKVLVRPDMADKYKGKNIIIGSPRTSEISQGVNTQEALDKRINKTGGARASTIGKPIKAPCPTHHRHFGACAQTVRNPHIQSGSSSQAVRQRPEAAASTRLQALTTINRYIEAKFI